MANLDLEPDEQSLCFTLTINIHRPRADGTGDDITTLGNSGGISPDPDMSTTQVLYALIRRFLDEAPDPWIRANAEDLVNKVFIQCWTLMPNRISKIIS